MRSASITLMKARGEDGSCEASFEALALVVALLFLGASLTTTSRLTYVLRHPKNSEVSSRATGSTLRATARPFPWVMDIFQAVLEP